MRRLSLHDQRLSETGSCRRVLWTHQGVWPCVYSNNAQSILIYLSSVCDSAVSNFCCWVTWFIMESHSKQQVIEDTPHKPARSITEIPYYLNPAHFYPISTDRSYAIHRHGQCICAFQFSMHLDHIAWCVVIGYPLPLLVNTSCRIIFVTELCLVCPLKTPYEGLVLLSETPVQGSMSILPNKKSLTKQILFIEFSAESLLCQSTLPFVASKMPSTSQRPLEGKPKCSWASSPMRHWRPVWSPCTYFHYRLPNPASVEVLIPPHDSSI